MSRVCERIAGNIAGHEIFVFAQADDDRRAGARRDDFARVLGGENRQGVDAAQPLDGLAHGVFERAAVHVFLDQVRDDFGIRLGDELVAFLFQFVLQLDVVFDDAVVHDDDLARAVAVRMGVFFGGAPVRGPARVAEAVDAVDRRAGGWPPRDCAACPRRGAISSLPSSLTTAMPAES